MKLLNSDYESKRNNNFVLLPPEIVEAKSGLFYDWLEKNNRLLLNIEPEITFINADVTRTKQIVLNLISNAAKFCENKGILLADTKFEFGFIDDQIILIDEVLTPDSSRFWIRASYRERIENGEEPENIDKEFLRLWFAKNCDPYNDEVLPDAPDELVAELSARYILLYELITGQKFVFPNLNNIDKRITENIKELL